MHGDRSFKVGDKLDSIQTIEEARKPQVEVIKVEGNDITVLPLPDSWITPGEFTFDAEGDHNWTVVKEDS